MMNEVDGMRQEGNYSKDWVMHCISEKAICDFESGR